MKTKELVMVVLLFAASPLPASSAPDVVAALSTATNHYEWARFSREIDKQGVTVARTNAVAFVRHQLVRLSRAGVKERDAIKAEIIGLGPQATPTLITALTNAVRPAPIFTGDSAVVNIPIFAAQVLGKMKKEDAMSAVPALIGFIDYETDAQVMVDGKPLNMAVEQLKSITGQDFGTDKAKWKAWYDKQSVNQ
jgi:hypothetical protein